MCRAANRRDIASLESAASGCFGCRDVVWLAPLNVGKQPEAAAPEVCSAAIAAVRILGANGYYRPLAVGGSR